MEKQNDSDELVLVHALRRNWALTTILPMLLFLEMALLISKTSLQASTFGRRPGGFIR